jgi:vancomycin resistance protein YoaR
MALSIPLSSTRAKSIAIVAIATVAGLAIGVLLVPRAPTPADEQAPPPEVRLLGTGLALGDDAGKEALERVRRYAAGRITLILPDGLRREVQLGRLGAEIDRVRLAQLVRDARDRTSPLRLAWRQRDGDEPLELPVPIAIPADKALPALLLLKDELDRLPVDARLDLEKRQLSPEVNGRLLDVDRSLLALQQAVGAGERSVEVVFDERKPKRVAAELAGVKFDRVLGWFETRYDRSARYLARSFNLRLAASKLDGTVLLPGETFDFNEVVGPRDEASGYKVALVIAEGELVDGIGGGTCQISGTLHGAAFFAGLEIVERYPHTRPSSYIKMGLDATVVYPTINFRVKNPFSHPVVLHQSVKNGIVRAEILGPERSRTVTLIRKIDGVIPYEQLERPSDLLPEGKRVLSQRGVPGFKLHRYRIVREGRHAVRERWNDLYPPTTQIINVGTGLKVRERAAPEDDKHPEYLADELLVQTQGIETEDGDSARDQMRESREPGKYGKPGWTEAAGMPFWRGDDAAPSAGDGARESKPEKAAKKQPG